MRCIFVFLFLTVGSSSFAQKLVTPSERWTTKTWDAQWITTPAGGNYKGVAHFRKSFNLWEKPTQFIIHISADNRYRLFVNGIYVNDGPQLSDLRHWRFESLDITGFVQKGSNTIAVQVWNHGDEAAINQMGKKLALIVQGDNPVAAVVNTDKSWKSIVDPGVSPIIFKQSEELFWSYYAAGPMDKMEGKKLPWDWEKTNFDDSKWQTSVELQAGYPFQTATYGDPQWELMPRNIPLMERTYQSFASVRRTTGMAAVEDFNAPVIIPPKQKVSLIVDQGRLTTAFPEWVISKGAGSEIKILYAEAVFDNIKEVGHRDSIGKKTVHGVYDLIYPEGGEKRTYTTLAYRTFRYVQLDITTDAAPLTIEKFGSWFTAYPFEKKATFAASDSTLSKVFDVGWYTQRLCAYETYMDCPYWERLQYIGDTRIQALVSYYVSGDERLARNSIEQFEWSLQYDGLTGSRYPSSLPQFIPNYSLVWVTMVYDYFLYGRDLKFVEARMPNVRRVLEHFKKYVTDGKLMTSQPYWDFLDHSYSARSIMEGSENKTLTANALFYAYTLDMAVKLETHFGNTSGAAAYDQLSKDLKVAVNEKCWDAGRTLFSDSPDKKFFSMHTNILAVLCNMMPVKEQRDIVRILINDNSLTKTTLYFDFYLGRAMCQAKSGDLYHLYLGKWKNLLKLGLTTFPEGVQRSDCHAWSASPDYEMLATFAGIDSDAPGFTKIVFRPQLADGEKVKASFPHWAGKVDVEFSRVKDNLKGRVTLPQGLTGRVVWDVSEKDFVLKPGSQNLDMKPPMVETVIKKKK